LLTLGRRTKQRRQARVQGILLLDFWRTISTVDEGVPRLPREEDIVSKGALEKETRSAALVFLDLAAIAQSTLRYNSDQLV
jgi:hypothetical protein